VLYAEKDQIVTLDTSIRPNDPSFSRLWGMQTSSDCDIDAPEAWAIHRGQGEVIVGVIDTGVDYNHPDLRDNMWVNPGEIPGNGVDDDNNGYIDDVYGANFITDSGNPFDDNRHGTHCAGTIGAKGNNRVGVVGVTWNVKIMALKFLSSSGSGSVSNAVEALNYAIMMGAHLTSNSWGGGGFSQAMLDAIEAANANDQLFIAAAGNSRRNNDVTPHYPSNYDVANVISVAATDSRDNLASFSCYGRRTVDVGAPGVYIYSTIPSNRYASLSGTSMATPHVAGLAALLLDYMPSMTASQLKEIIMESGDPVTALHQKTLTGRRINAHKALLMAQGRFGVFEIVGNSSRMLAGGESQDVTIRAGGTMVQEGLFQAKLRMDAGDWVGNGTEVSLRVIGEPRLSISPETINFGLVGIDTNVTRVAKIRNNGTGSATISSATVENAFGWTSTFRSKPRRSFGQALRSLFSLWDVPLCRETLALNWC